MFKTILMPFDGSEPTTHALPYATALARATQGRLVLTYALAPWELSFDAPLRLYDIGTELREAGLDVTTHIAPPHLGNPGRAILAMAGEVGADVIVMGTHAYGSVGRALFGSVADYVVRHSTLPVLVCTPLADRVWPEERPRRILVPLDGSALAETALSPAREIAREIGASLDLVGAIDLATVAAIDHAVQVGAYLEMLAGETRGYLERVAEDLRQEGTVVDVQARAGVPDAVVTQLADELSSDLIVMATHGRGVSRMLLGSVALRILQRSTVPVLLIHPAAAIVERTTTTPIEAGARPAGEQTYLALTAAELELLRRSLELLRHGSGSEQQSQEGVTRLLNRLPKPPVPAL